MQQSNDVFAAIFRGEISPEDAEALAISNGWAPFCLSPNASRQNPLDEPHWELSMALAWIAWRDPTRVCEHWNAHLATCSYWMKSDNGYTRHAYPRATVSSMLRQEYSYRLENGCPQWENIVADETLFRYLKEGSLKARSNRCDVPATDWTELMFCESPFGHDALKERPGIEQNIFTDFIVLRDQVLALFEPVAHGANRDVGGRPEEYDWPAIRLVAKSLVADRGMPEKGNKRLPSKQQLIEAICNHFAERGIELSPQTVRTHLRDWLAEPGFNQN